MGARQDPLVRDAQARAAILTFLKLARVPIPKSPILRAVGQTYGVSGFRASRVLREMVEQGLLREVVVTHHADGISYALAKTGRLK